MIFQFEMVGYPISQQRWSDGPQVKTFTVEAPNLFEAYYIANRRGISECDGRCTIQLKNSPKQK